MSLINLAGSWSGPVEQSVLMFLITSDTLLEVTFLRLKVFLCTSGSGRLSINSNSLSVDVDVAFAFSVCFAVDAKAIDAGMCSFRS